MQKTIAQLWTGNVDLLSHFGVKNSEMKELERLLRKNLDNLTKDFNSEQMKIMENYEALFSQYMVASSEEAFCNGFSLGVRLIAEAMTGLSDVI